MDRMFDFKAVKYKRFRKAANVQKLKGYLLLLHYKMHSFKLIIPIFEYFDSSYFFNLGFQKAKVWH